MTAKQAALRDERRVSKARFFVLERLLDLVAVVKATRGLHLSLDRFHRQHLLREGAYAQLKKMLPIIVLCGVWLQILSGSLGQRLSALGEATVTLRHILLAVAVVLLWNAVAGNTPRRVMPKRKALTMELGLLVRGSALCGLLLFFGHASHASTLRSAELGGSLAGALLGSSLLLFAVGCCLSTEFISYRLRSRKAIIVGSGPRASSLRAVAQKNYSRIEIVGCIDNCYVGNSPSKDGYLGDLSLLPDLLKSQPIEVVFIGLPVKSHYDQIQNIISICEAVGVESHYRLDVFQTTRTQQQSSPAPSELAVLGDHPSGFRQRVKRGLDLAIASPMLLLLTPLMLAIALAIKLTSPGPVFFVQQRYGQNRHRFLMFKFRTMVIDAEQKQGALEASNEAGGPVFKMKADPRITSFGTVLRRTSLDELPQLINVLRGDMSLVGPRPLPLRDVSRFEEAWLLRRFSVPPGLTCLWQVRGRSNTRFDEWMKLDLEYIDSWTLGLDLAILAQTLPAVLRGSGAM